MGRHEKKTPFERLRQRYQAANKVKKSLILAEYCENYGYNRKYAIRKLNIHPKRRPSKPKKRLGRPRYNRQQLLPVLMTIWLATNRFCSKKLVAALPEWLPHYEQEKGLLTDAMRGQLYSLSASTIDRWLSAYRQKHPRRLGGTKPGTLLKTHIPIKTHHWDVNRPGFLEADTVAHCGNSLSGDFIWSITYTDIFSTWTEIRATWNKGAEGVKKQTEDVEHSLPFSILGFDCDNGSEFLNWHLIRYFTERKKENVVQFTRSRPYHKDDNAHVEQKNWTHVRQLFGYARFDNPRLVAMMNDLYCNEWSLYQNHFCPTMKLKEKIRINSRYKKTYDEAKTPYLRLLKSAHISEEKKAQLKVQHQALNPFALRRAIDRKLKAILQLVSVTFSMRQRF